MATVDIEWVGDPPLLDELTKLRIQLGELPSMSAAVIRAAESQRRSPFTGVTVRRVDVDSFHTSRDYTFGPYVFVTAVDAKDVDKILGSPSGHQFRIVGEPGIEIIRPPIDLAFVNEVEGVSLTDIFQ
jgi:hypothetical protein